MNEPIFDVVDPLDPEDEQTHENPIDELRAIMAGLARCPSMAFCITRAYLSGRKILVCDLIDLVRSSSFPAVVFIDASTSNVVVLHAAPDDVGWQRVDRARFKRPGELKRLGRRELAGTE